MKTRTTFFASALVAATFAFNSSAQAQGCSFEVDGTPVDALIATAPTGAAGLSEFDLLATERMERELDKQIDRYVTYPYLEREAIYGAVVVTYVVDAEGKLKIMRSEATDERLLDHVLAKLDRVDVGENPSGLWTKTTARFLFAPQR